MKYIKHGILLSSLLLVSGVSAPSMTPMLFVKGLNGPYGKLLIK